MDSWLMVLFYGLTVGAEVLKSGNGPLRSREGFTFAQYDVRCGGVVILQCVTKHQVKKFSFTQRDGHSTTKEFHFSTNPTRISQRHIIFKETFSTLFNVYSLRIDLVSVEENSSFWCHTSVGKKFETRVKVTGNKCHRVQVSFSQMDYVFKKGTSAQLSCIRPNHQRFHSFSFRKDSFGKSSVIMQGVQGYNFTDKYKIYDEFTVNYTLLNFLMSDESKVGLYYCNADDDVTVTKVSMACQLLDKSLKTFVLKQGEMGHLRIRWKGSLVQRAILSSWFKLEKSADLSQWQYAKKSELASRYGSSFFAVSDRKYLIENDGTLVLRDVNQIDAGFYKFKLMCGLFGETEILVKVIVI